MRKSKLNQKGFGLIEGLLILIVVLLVGFIGYYVWNSQKEADDTANQAASSVQTEKQQTAPKPVYKNADVTLYNLSDLATNGDQTQIVAAIKKKCVTDLQSTDKTIAAEDVLVVGIETTFSDSASYAKSGEFARLATTCLTKPIEPDSSGSVYILQKKSGNWTVILSGQMGPNCSEVDGKNIPSTIVDECYDEATSQNRAPN